MARLVELSDSTGITAIPVLAILRGRQQTMDDIRCKVKQTGINLALSVMRNETACKFGIVQMVRDVVDTQIDET
jgi:hypothetical protein